MNTLTRKRRFSPAAATVALLLAGCSAMLYASDLTVDLSGKEEVPPVKTSASGRGTLSVNPDQSVSGSVKTTGVAATMAHIHAAPAGQNGPVVIPLNKTADNVWSVPAGSKLSDAAYKDFKAGKLYFNVHSEAQPGGEIRGQLVPPAGTMDQGVRSGGY